MLVTSPKTNTATQNIIGTTSDFVLDMLPSRN